MKLEILSVMPSHVGSYQLSNSQGWSEIAELQLLVDGKMGPWGEYGTCSRSCTPSGERSGYTFSGAWFHGFESVNMRSKK